MGLVVALTALAVVNTLVLSVLDRRRELALLRAVGATRRQARDMLLQESLWISGLSILLGGAIAASVLTAFSIGMTGSAAPFIDVTLAASVGGVAVMLAVTSTAAALCSACATRGTGVRNGVLRTCARSSLMRLAGQQRAPLEQPPVDLLVQFLTGDQGVVTHAPAWLLHAGDARQRCSRAAPPTAARCRAGRSGQRGAYDGW